MKTAMVFRTIALSVFKIDYKLRCLEYICSVSSPLRRQALAALAPLGLLIVKTQTNVLELLLDM